MTALWPRGEELGVHLAMGGVALLLVILLLVTPVLENPTLGGTLLSRAQLEVDVVNDTFLLYVDSNGHVRFSTISLGINTTLPAATPPVADIQWPDWFNWSNRITTMVPFFNVTQFAINISTVYFQPGQSSPEYLSWGVYAFAYNAGGGTVTAIPLSPGLPLTTSQTWSVSQLPQTLSLAEKTIPISSSSTKPAPNG